jgi:hypothetical protein
MKKLNFDIQIDVQYVAKKKPQFIEAFFCLC